VRGRNLKLVGEGLSAQQFAIAVPKGSSLLEPLNAALLAIESDGRFAALSEMYLSETPAPDAPTAGAATVIALPTPTPAAVQPAVVAPACLNSMKWIADLNLDDQNMHGAADPGARPGLHQGLARAERRYVRLARRLRTGVHQRQPHRVGDGRQQRQAGAQSCNRASRSTSTSTCVRRRPMASSRASGKCTTRCGQSFGETVWVGVQVPDPNPPVIVTTPPPATINPNLRADNAYIAAGQCTTLRWEIDNVRSVFLIDGGNQQGVAGHDARSVCPGATDDLHAARRRQ
jgi:hypothetical protein